MKISKFFYGFVILAFLLVSCAKDEVVDIVPVEAAELSQEVSSKFFAVDSVSN